ncbi:MAG: glycosyltransferase [Bacteroidia bacterium]|nr:glycosyltransferase [Bacteroidia bacterium]
MIILLSLLGASALVLAVYYLYFFSKLKNINSVQGSSNNLPPVSVVISARNEKKNLEEFLPLILNQDYPNFEVIVVNDWSFDGTSELIEKFAKEHNHLKLVKIEVDERFKRGKKFALTMGIKAAKNERLLFTDADCFPKSTNWISAMMQANEGENDIILGNAPLVTKIGPLGALIKYETFHTAIQYLSYAVRGKTYMGVGRNLSYTKTLFFENKGFASHQHILSGDDDLFIQETASSDNVAVCINSNSFMYSAGPKGIRAWIKQKTRHFSTSSLYKGRFKRLLGLYSLAQIVFFFTAALGFILFPQQWYFVASFVLLKWLIQWIVMYKPAMQLDAKSVRFLLPILDIFYSLFLILFGILKVFIKPRTWS